MENPLKKQFIYTVTSFILLISIWLLICLSEDVNSVSSKTLAIISLIPCATYIVCGTKLLNALGIERFYLRL